MDAAWEDIAISMQIECPACAARYDVPDEVVRPGRPMRCARCGETWTPRPTPPEPAQEVPSLVIGAASGLADDVWPAAEAGAGSEEGDARLPLAAALSRRGEPALIVAWVASGVVLLAGAWAIWHFHLRLERAWPPSERLFRLFG